MGDAKRREALGVGRSYMQQQALEERKRLEEEERRRVAEMAALHRSWFPRTSRAPNPPPDGD